MAKRWLLAVVALVAVLAGSQPAYALSGTYHRPYGKDDIYVASAANTDRWPLDPYAGQIEYIKVTTWPVESGDSVVVNWSKNNDGVSRQASAAWQSNSGNNSYWQAAICDPSHSTGSSPDTCNEGDAVTYTVVASQTGGGTAQIGPYTYITRKAPVSGDYYAYLTTVTGATRVGNHVELTVSSSDGGFSPKVAISFPYQDAVRVQAAPSPAGITFADGVSSFTLSTSNPAQYSIYTGSVQVLIQTNPWRLTFQKNVGGVWTQFLQEYDPTSHHNIQWDGGAGASAGVWHTGEWFTSQPSEYYLGFGARYNTVYKRNEDVDIYSYNQYKNQGAKSYLPMPFFHSTAGYGVFINTPYYTNVRLNTEPVGGATPGDIAGWNSDSSKSASGLLDYDVFSGGPKTVLDEFTTLTGGHPVVPPKWALGPIMSANEWNSDSFATQQLNTTMQDQIAATLMVLEQWSDETTFYVWKGANFTPNDGSTSHAYGDFSFGTTWPNPKAFVDNLHANNVHLILWQVPLNKVPDSNSTNQNSITEDNNNASYMESATRKYAAWDPPTGSYYQNAAGWFPNAPFVDFTKTSATNWWLAKRGYLFNMSGTSIDGFKTDGGEDIWYENTQFTDDTGNVSTKRAMHNLYPVDYTKAYYNYVQQQTANNGVIFARSGGIGSQLTPMYWAGDQNSDFGEFTGQVTAAITAGASGVPFYGWDLAGFSGGINGSDIPTVELYDRAWPVSAFAPVTEYHSENNGSDGIQHARSPWNMQARTADASTYNTGKQYANLRMNLLPYVWSSSVQSGQSGTPLMRPLYLDFPTDPNVVSYPTEYMFGDSFLVAPVLTQGATSQTVFLPGGEWVDFANTGRHYGSTANNFSYGVSNYSTVPTFVKSGSIVPMNLDNSFALNGTWVGNNVNSTTNLTFVGYPGGSTNLAWQQNANGSGALNLTMAEDYLHHQITVTYPSGMPVHYWKLFTTQPSAVNVNGAPYSQLSSLSSLLTASTGWYYDSQNQWLYVKNPASSAAITMTISGTDKAAFEAEFGTFSGTCSATNHAGYTGTGFVACFDAAGKYQDVPVTVTAPATYQLNFRYSNGGTATATRTVYVDGNYFSHLDLPVTANWDTWGTAPLLVSLPPGQHTIRVSWDSGDSVDVNPINFDNIGLVATPGPAKAFDHEEVLLGNNYYAAMVDRRGTLYDTQEPMGMYTGVYINDQNPTFNVSTAIHAQQGVVGISSSGQDPQWFSSSAWTFSGQDYLTDTAIYQLTANNSSLNLQVTEQDFSPRGIIFPSSTDAGTPPVNGLLVKRLSIKNTGASPQTIDVSYWAHLSINMEPYSDAVSCNRTDDVAYFNDPGGYGSGRNRTIAYGIAVSAPSGATTSCTAYPAAALQKKTFSIAAGATQEADILVAGATKPASGQSLYSSWIQPALSWFRSNSMSSIQSQTQTSWTSQLAEAGTIDSYPTGGTDYNKVLHRALVLSILHLDLTHGAFAAGFKNIGYPAMWPRDTAYGVMTLDRSGIRDYATSAYSFLNSLTRATSGGYWEQKYMLDGTVQWTQPQADETAILPYGVYQHYLQTGDRTFLDSNWQLVQNAAAAVMPGASDTGYGWDSSSHLFFSNNIWEDTYGEFLYTNAAIVAGLQAASSIATIEGNSTLATSWQNQANDILNNGIQGTITNASALTTPGSYDSDIGRYVFARNIRKTRTDGPALILNPISADVSQLGVVWPFGILPANDPKVAATASEVQAGLGDTAEVGSTGGIARYRHDQNSRYSPSGSPDYSPFNDTYFDGGPWEVATLWMADYDLQRAQANTGKTYVDAAKQYMDALIGWTGPLYVGSEQVDHLAGQQPDGSWLKQAAWPNLWESNASLADTLLMLLDYNWNATSGTLTVKPKIPSSWSAVGGNITINPNGSSSQKVYVKHQHPGGTSADTVTFNNNAGRSLTVNIYVQTDFSPSSVTGLSGLTWSYDASSGRVLVQGTVASGAAITVTLNR